MHVLRFDPRTMEASTGAAVESPTVLAIEAGGRGTTSLWWSDGAFSVAAAPPKSGALRLASGIPSSAPPAVSSRAGVGIQDEDGMVVWVELSAQEQRGPQAMAAMDSLLERLGCSERMMLSHDARALVGGTLDIAGDVAFPVVASATRFVRVRAPDAHAAFVDTPIVPNSIWQPLQAKRVRYFYRPTSTTPKAVAAQPTASPSTGTGGEPSVRPNLPW
jgi:hypothetical protein